MDNLKLANQIIKELEKSMKIKDISSQKQNNKIIIEQNKLPSTGIVAGQAIAEVYFHLMGINIQTRIKDIDIFFDIDSISKRTIKDYINHSLYEIYGNDFRSLNDTQIDLITKKSNDYEDESKVFQEIDYSYKIHNSYEIGNINLIEISSTFNKESFKSENYNLLREVIEGFDINAIKIGIDLKTKELYISNDFLNFLKTKQMQIVNFRVNPIKSIIRYMEKSQYYKGDVFFNVEYELQLLYPYLYFMKKINQKQFSSLTIKYDKLNQKNKDILDQYFSIKQSSFDSIHFQKLHYTTDDYSISHIPEKSKDKNFYKKFPSLLNDFLLTKIIDHNYNYQFLHNKYGSKLTNQLFSNEDLYELLHYIFFHYFELYIPQYKIDYIFIKKEYPINKLFQWKTKKQIEIDLLKRKLNYIFNDKFVQKDNIVIDFKEQKKLLISSLKEIQFKTNKNQTLRKQTNKYLNTIVTNFKANIQGNLEGFDYDNNKKSLQKFINLNSPQNNVDIEILKEIEDLINNNSFKHILLTKKIQITKFSLRDFHHKGNEKSKKLNNILPQNIKDNIDYWDIKTIKITKSSAKKRISNFSHRKNNFINRILEHYSRNKAELFNKNIVNGNNILENIYNKNFNFKNLFFIDDENFLNNYIFQNKYNLSKHQYNRFEKHTNLWKYIFYYIEYYQMLNFEAYNIDKNQQKIIINFFFENLLNKIKYLETNALSILGKIEIQNIFISIIFIEDDGFYNELFNLKNIEKFNQKNKQISQKFINQIKLELKKEEMGKSIKEIDHKLLNYIFNVNENTNESKILKDIFSQKKNNTKLHENITIEHISNTVRLIQEGKNMHHCVGGYTNKLQKYTYLFFHITYNNIDYTLAYKPSNNKLHKDIFEKITTLITTQNIDENFNFYENNYKENIFDSEKFILSKDDNIEIKGENLLNEFNDFLINNKLKTGKIIDFKGKYNKKPNKNIIDIVNTILIPYIEFLIFVES